jgi:hypothetical protein
MLRAIRVEWPTLFRWRQWTSGAVLLLLLSASHAQRMEKLHDSIKKQSVSVRLVGRTPPLPVTTFGANYQSFVATLQADKDFAPQVKLVYRFLSYDQGPPAAFMDYNYVHKFRAVRQPDCDESAAAILYSRHSSPTGETLNSNLSFEYARGATGVAIPPTAVLPCYVVTPGDYQGSTRLPARIPGTPVAETNSTPIEVHNAP